jgi:hypothetical protein
MPNQIKKSCHIWLDVWEADRTASNEAAGRMKALIAHNEFKKAAVAQSLEDCREAEKNVAKSKEDLAILISSLRKFNKKQRDEMKKIKEKIKTANKVVEYYEKIYSDAKRNYEDTKSSSHILCSYVHKNSFGDLENSLDYPQIGIVFRDVSNCFSSPPLKDTKGNNITVNSMNMRKYVKEHVKETEFKCYFNTSCEEKHYRTKTDLLKKPPVVRLCNYGTVWRFAYIL